jgi:hypothetical protein
MRINDDSRFGPQSRRLLLLLGWVLSLTFAPMAAWSAPPADRQVDTSVRRAAAWLLDRQGQMGGWSSVNARYADGGTTALTVLALVETGMDADQPAIRAAVNTLSGLLPDRTTSRALRTMLYTRLGSGFIAEQGADVRWLIDTQRDDGGWAETSAGEGPSNTFDTGMAVLALTDARARRADVPAEVLQKAMGFLAAAANDDGGFGYYPPDAKPLRVRGMSHGSATAAAAAAAAGLLRDGLGEATGLQRSSLGWLAGHYQLDRVPAWPWGDSPDYAYRHMLLEATRTLSPMLLGKHRLDEDMVRWLVSHQGRDGRFSGRPLAETDVVATAWGLMTLAKLRRPLAAQYLAVGKVGPAATASLSRALTSSIQASQVEGTWRRLPSASRIQDSRRSPLLIIGCAGAFDLPVETRDALKRYLHSGGTVVLFAAGEDDICLRTADEFFRALIEGYASTPLAAEHPVRNDAFEIPELSVTVIGNRSRKRIYLLPADIDEQWAKGRQADTAEAFDVLANLLAFSHESMPVTHRFEPIQVAEAAAPPPRVLKVGRLMHDGDWNVEPEANRVLSRSLVAAMSVGLESRPIRPNQDIPADLAMLWVTGSKLGELAPVHRENIQDYVTAGGLVLFDAAYGDKTFFDAAIREGRRLFGDDAIVPLAADHPLLTGKFADDLGSDVTSATFGRFAARKFGREEGLPRLLVAMQNGRIVAVFSPLGIAGAIEGAPPHDAIVYTARDAKRIALNILLYATAARSGAIEAR